LGDSKKIILGGSKDNSACSVGDCLKEQAFICRDECLSFNQSEMFSPSLISVALKVSVELVVGRDEIVLSASFRCKPSKGCGWRSFRGQDSLLGFESPEILCPFRSSSS
jgi:hypothetical protein